MSAATSSLRASANVLRGLLMANVLLAAVMIGVASSVSDSARRGALTKELVDQYQAVSVGASALLLVTGVAWCVWQYRAQANLRTLGATGLRFSPRWAIGSWFVPLVNFVVPYQSMKELVLASDPDLRPSAWTARKRPSVVVWWWATWIGVAVLGRLESFDDFADATFAQAFLIGLLLAVSAALASRVVGRVTRAQMSGVREPVAAPPSGAASADRLSPKESGWVVQLLGIAVGLGVGVISTWWTVVAFVGGRMPLLPISTDGGAVSGFAWLMIVNPIVLTLAYWLGGIVGGLVGSVAWLAGRLRGSRT